MPMHINYDWLVSASNEVNRGNQSDLWRARDEVGLDLDGSTSSS